MCAEGGIERITVAGLCKKSCIAKSTFYLYFDDKYAVMESAENELLEALRSISYDLRDIDLKALEKGQPVPKAVAMSQYLRENAPAFRVLLGRYGDAQFLYKWKKDIEDSFMERFQAEHRNGRNAKLACTIFSSSLIGIFTDFLFDANDMTDSETAVIMGNLLRYALLEFDANVS